MFVGRVLGSRNVYIGRVGNRAFSSFSQLQYPLRTNPPVITQHNANTAFVEGNKDDKLEPPCTGEILLTYYDEEQANGQQ